MSKEKLIEEINNFTYPEIQMRAVYQARYQIGDMTVFHTLLDIAYKQCSPNFLKKMAAESMVCMDPVNALAAISRLVHHSNPYMRTQSFYHLCTLQTPEAVGVIIKGLKDPVPKVRTAAAVASRYVGYQTTIIAALKNLTNSYEQAPVRNAAKKSLEILDPGTSIQNEKNKQSENFSHALNMEGRVSNDEMKPAPSKKRFFSLKGF